MTANQREVELSVLSAKSEDLRHLAFAIHKIANVSFLNADQLATARGDLRAAIEKVFTR